MSHPEVIACISSLQPGGAEYTFREVVTALHGSGKRVLVVTLKAGSVELDLPEGVSRVSLRRPVKENFLTKSFLFFSLLVQLTALFRRYPRAQLLSFMTQTNVFVCVSDFLSLFLLGYRKKRRPVVVAERIHPEHAPFLGDGVLRPFFRAVRNVAYRRATKIVVQSSSMRGAFPPCLRERIFVIPNAKRPFSSEGEIPQGRKPKILCVGRLVPQKDYLTALRAFSDVAALYPSWMLQIVGSGPEQARLEERVRALQLEARVEFVPFQHDLLPFYLEASVLLSTSRYEGFPNVILEAMSFGLPIVATDCPGATQELVTDGVQGELVPVGDLRALRVALRRVLDSESLRRSMGENGKKAAQRYDHSTIMSRWNMLFSL